MYNSSITFKSSNPVLTLQMLKISKLSSILFSPQNVHFLYKQEFKTQLHSLSKN